MSAPTTRPAAIERGVFIDRYRRNRDRSRRLFDLLSDATYYTRPIPLRHPIVFYEGHLPAFSFNTLVKQALGRPSIDPPLETLFARGIDPHESAEGGAALERSWPDRATVQQFAAEADRQVLDALGTADIEQPGHPLLDRAEAVFTILEHEEMHDETLLYMWHRLPLRDKRAPSGYLPITGGDQPRPEWVDVDPGRVTLGVNRGSVPFAWDNECPSYRVRVEAFAIERYEVTNLRYLEFVEADGYEDERWWQPGAWQWLRAEGVQHPLFWERHDGGWFWRGLFDLIRLPLAWPVYVSQAEACAYARWRGLRLPTEAEFQRAAFGTPRGDERPQPWGDGEPTAAHGVFDFASWDPEPAGTHPAGRSAWGADDLVGNGWEWTGTAFEPFPGFRPMASYPQYSADFFDGEHFVMKGASPATSSELLRPTFRNWFRARYPYVYAKFRCAGDAGSRR